MCQLVSSNVESDDLNDLIDLNDLNDPNDPNDPNDWMTESFAIDRMVYFTNIDFTHLTPANVSSWT